MRSVVRRVAGALGALAVVTGCSTGSGEAGPAAPAASATSASASANASASAATSSTPALPPTTAATGTASLLSSSPAATAGPTPPAGPAAAPPPELARFYTQQPRWTGCDGGFECARITVPRDYDAPGGATLALSVIRLRTRGAERIGSLLLNPGGPGGSGVDYARSAEGVVSAAVRERFDIIGFDPRGVGQSNPVDCLSDRELERVLRIDGTPDTPAEEQELVAAAKQQAQGCQRRSGALLPHIGTPDAARDMDVLRAVLGDERLHYLGKSYGTYLGATYAELFPARVGALVLDGAVDPAASAEDVSREQAKGFETALGAFVDDCLQVADCPLEGPKEAAVGQVGALLREVDRRPLDTQEGRRVPEALAVLGLVTALYDESSGWPLLRQALAEAENGRGDALLLLADLYTEREPGGGYRSNMMEVISAVNCLDRRAPGDLPTVRARADAFAAQAPTFGRYLAWSDLLCEQWPVPAAGTPHPIAAPGARPILVVGTTRDPATPYRWSEALAGQLESGVLLGWDGDGHTAYQRGSTCIDSTVDAYLLRGEVPEDGKRCD